MTRFHGLRASAAAITTLALAGCITITPLAAPKATNPAPAASAAAAAAKKAPEAAARPKAGDAATLDKLKAEGRVQVSFKGLGGKARRTLKQTTDDIARVEVTIQGANGFEASRALSREEMMGPMASLFFDRVPIGPATLRVRAFDVGGAAIGGGEEALEVVGGKTTEIGMAVKLGATGGVGATIAFEDADVDETNVTGYWYVGGDGPPPAYPVIGCGDGYVWYVTQFGDSVRATTSGYDADGPHAGMWWSEEAYGSIRDGLITLHGRTTYTDDQGNEAAAPEEAEYALKFDADRWQMVGTRNGRPGWATPYYFEPGCHGGATPPPLVAPATPAPYWSPGPGEVRTGKLITVEGVLYDSDGEPVANAEVWLDGYDDARPFSGATTTDAEGRYRFEGVPTGVELEFYADTEDETADAWQVFYGFDAVEHHDLWMSMDEDWDDEDEEEDDGDEDADADAEVDEEAEDEEEADEEDEDGRPAPSPTPTPTPTPTPLIK